jgi:FkbM family methyltransferase
MGAMPSISIVIPAFNHESFVREALDSTLNSGLGQVEVLVCDDASSDGTPQIIREWASQHEDRFSRFVFVEHEKNTGIGVALNELIAESRGDIIHCLASDDYYLPGGLLAKTNAMLANPEWAGAFCDGMAVALNGGVLQESLMAVSGIDTAKLGSSDIAHELLYHWREPANLLSWRRSAFKIHGGEFEYDPTVFCEDLDFAWWAMSKGSLGYVPSVCYAYRCKSWPQTNQRNPIRERRDIAHVLAKYAPAFPPQLADSMRNLAFEHFYRAANDVELADAHMRRFQAEAATHSSPPAPFVSYASNLEDVLLWRALQHVERGFYVDVGARDPEEGSVTKAFYDRGWHGINIEPKSRLHERIREARPRDINLAVAAGAANGESILLDVPAVQGWATPHEAIIHRARGHEIERSTVPVRRLASICDDHSVSQIHFLRVSVGGAEAEVISGMDLTRWRPWILVIRASFLHSQTGHYQNWEATLLDKGYRFSHFDGLNRYYVAEEHDDLQGALGTQPNVWDEFVTAREARAADVAQKAYAWAEESSAAALSAEARAQDAEARALDAEVRARDAEARAVDADATARDAAAQLAAVAGSASWRITRPLRWLKRALAVATGRRDQGSRTTDAR